MSTETTTQRPLTRPDAPSSDVLGAGRRGVVAVLVDVVLALVPLLVVPLLALTRLPSVWAWTIAVLGVFVVGTGLLRQLTSAGVSPGRRLLGVRTVATTTLMPPSVSELVRRQVIDADLRAGRDPLRLVPHSSTPLQPTSWDGWRTPAAGTGGWVLVFDNGQRAEIDRSTLIGRNPTNEPGQQHALVAIPDLTRSISRVHALVEPADECLWLTDGGATNGTRAAVPSASGGTVIERWLRPGERVAVRSGGLIHLGDRELRVTRSLQPGA